MIDANSSLDSEIRRKANGASARPARKKAQKASFALVARNASAKLGKAKVAAQPAIAFSKPQNRNIDKAISGATIQTRFGARAGTSLVGPEVLFSGISQSAEPATPRATSTLSTVRNPVKL